MRNTQIRKVFFGVLLMVAIATLLIQPSLKSTAESKTRERKASGQPAKTIVESDAKAGKAPGQQANTITQTDEVMSVSSPTAMSPEQLPKASQSQTLQYGEDEEEGAILSDISPQRLQELKDQSGDSKLETPESVAPGYAAQTDSSTSSADKSLLEPLAPNSFVNFEGPDDLSQLDGFLHRPPDGGMAAGPSHVVVSVNSLIAIYDKNGTKLFSVSLATWFTNVCSGCSPFDPRVVYDPVAGRWILIAVHRNTTSVSNYLLSVSQTSDPTGGWWLYNLNGALTYPPTGDNTWADFPHLGFDGIPAASGGAIYITSNQFTFGTNSFRTSMLNILPKSALYSGAGFSYWRSWGRTNADASQAFTLSPALTYGNPGGEFLVNTKNAGSIATLWKVIPTYPPTAVNWTLQSTNSIGAYSIQPDASQPGGCALMATNDNRISSNSVWRNNQIYAAFAEGHNWGGGNVAAIRFLQIDTSTNATTQNVTFGADGLSYFFPSLAADASDNVVLTFARAGSSEFGSARYTGRLATDALNTLQGSAQLKGGAECITGGRWGDYSAAAVDPADTGKVWIFGHWAKDLSGVSSDWDWGTWVGQVGFGTTTRTLTVGSSNPGSGVNITVSPNDNSNLGNGTTQFTRTYNNNTSVNLTAPVTAGGNDFQKWQRDGSDWTTNQSTSVTMDASHTMMAVYLTCSSPGGFSLSSPSNGQSLSSTTSVNLTWGASANADSYDVYFGTNSNPPFLANQTGTSRSVSVTPGQTYYWKVVAKVNCSSSTSTAGVWSFSVQTQSSTGVTAVSVFRGDFDGDGKADIAVWRPAGGVWYIMNSTGSQRIQGWGTNGDTPVPADYDGDGKTDLAVYRPSSGVWYIVNSLNGSQRIQGWGLSTDLPVPGDYDGDGKADIAVWRPSSGQWFILNSTNGSLSSPTWGTAGDIPAPGKYDADSKSDIAVWRPSSGQWYIINSSNGSQRTQGWGTLGDLPVGGDYDGDGKADLAVFRPSTGVWYIVNSLNNSQRIQGWGTNGDIPVASDYDGDAKRDIAVWRPSSGTWYIINSQDNSQRIQGWGMLGDVPVSGALIIR